MSENRIKMLVVDDSRIVRHVITDAVTAASEIQVVGHASNGEQALRMVAELDPDVITLDLEMPKMSGFTFLRLLLARRFKPVIVLSSHIDKDNVFKALDLGAFDFIPKPTDPLLSPDVFREELIKKVRLTRHMTKAPQPSIFPKAPPKGHPAPSAPPKFIVAVASSTGGPSALLHILSRIQPGYPGAIVIAQHMAPGFTRTFAERLDRVSALEVREATDGDVLLAGTAYVCPGGACMSVRQLSGYVLLDVSPPRATDRYVPSADRLLASTAKLMGPKAIGVVLTGMADDGAIGARQVIDAGGIVFAESEETAVVYGMPAAAVRAGVVTQELPLGRLAEALAAYRTHSTPPPQ